MKFFGKFIKRKELTVVVKEIFNKHNIVFKPVFIKGCFTINFYVAIVPNYFVVGRCFLLKGLFCALPMFQDFTIEALGRWLNCRELISWLKCVRKDSPQG